MFTLLLCLSSCEKSVVQPVESPNRFTGTKEANGYETEDGKSSMKLRSLHQLWLCDYAIFDIPCISVPLFCAWPPGNCLPTIVIQGISGNSDLNDLLVHIQQGTYDNYFSGNDFVRTFGVVREFPELHNLLKNRNLTFEITRSDTLDKHLYLIGYDINVDPKERTELDVLLTFEIDEN